MKLTLSMSEVIVLSNGLSQLDGYHKLGEKGVSVFTGFTFAGATKIAIARNRKKLSAIVDTYIEQRDSLLKQTIGEGKSLVDITPEQQNEFQKQEKEMLTHKEEVDLAMLTLEGLNLDVENNRNITPGVLAALHKIVPDLEE